jgi:hypothetical protein
MHMPDTTRHVREDKHGVKRGGTDARVILDSVVAAFPTVVLVERVFWQQPHLHGSPITQPFQAISHFIG